MMTMPLMYHRMQRLLPHYLGSVSLQEILRRRGNSLRSKLPWLKFVKVVPIRKQKRKNLIVNLTTVKIQMTLMMIMKKC